MDISVALGQREYTVRIQRGGILHVGDIFDLERKVLIVTDSGVPAEYAQTVAKKCREAYVYTFAGGEKDKNIDTWADILRELMVHGFTRSDCVVAVGGGVVGDVSGFAAATYMRGIDFYNVATTLLSQVDASVGGKTAIDFGGVKNSVGAFYQPKGVMIDPDLLGTLPQKHFSNGMAEVIKMAAVLDAELFAMLENEDAEKNLEKMIERCVRLKADIVARDERDGGVRKALNFGHTLGHAVESLGGRLHGECVALGMIPMCAPEIRGRVAAVLDKYGLASEFEYDERISQALEYDKKSDGGTISAVFCGKIGSYEIKRVAARKIYEILKGVRK